jgi:hypothetical protein
MRAGSRRKSRRRRRTVHGQLRELCVGLRPSTGPSDVRSAETHGLDLGAPPSGCVLVPLTPVPAGALTTMYGPRGHDPPGRGLPPYDAQPIPRAEYRADHVRSPHRHQLSRGRDACRAMLVPLPSRPRGRVPQARHPLGAPALRTGLGHSRRIAAGSRSWRGARDLKSQSRGSLERDAVKTPAPTSDRARREPATSSPRVGGVAAGSASGQLPPTIAQGPLPAGEDYHLDGFTPAGRPVPSGPAWGAHHGRHACSAGCEPMRACWSANASPPTCSPP